VAASSFCCSSTCYQAGKGAERAHSARDDVRSARLRRIERRRSIHRPRDIPAGRRRMLHPQLVRSRATVRGPAQPLSRLALPVSSASCDFHRRRPSEER
jgi:hypothetical protein